MSQLNEIPIVSVIMIFYNAEQFIKEAIESVIYQSFQNWELILVDDGSNDSSSKIAHNYASMFPTKIYYKEHHNHINKGMGASRNLGIKKSSGKYITFLDADDVLLPNKLEDQVAILNGDPKIDMVCGSTLYWYSWSGLEKDNLKDKIIFVGAPQNIIITSPQLIFLLHPLGEGSAPCMSALLIRRNVMDEVGGFEEIFKGMYEDQAFLIKVYLKFSVFISNECWDKYRQHPNSCSSVAIRESKYNNARKFFLFWMENYLKKMEEKDDLILNALKKNLWTYSHSIKNWFSHLPIKLKNHIQKIFNEKTKI